MQLLGLYTVDKYLLNLSKTHNLAVTLNVIRRSKIQKFGFINGIQHTLITFKSRDPNLHSKKDLIFRFVRIAASLAENLSLLLRPT